MNKNIGVVAGIIILVVVVGGIYVSMSNKNDAMVIKEQMEQKAMEEKDVMIKKDETGMMDKGDVMTKAGSYETYAPEKVALASSSHDIVLFFRASWCPTCRAV